MDIEVNNIKIHYEVIGEGNPIILLNPDSKNTLIMKFIAGKLKDKYKVYIFDRRCSGKSQSNCNLTYEDSAKDVVDFINKLKIKSPILLGCSGGGRVALNVAINYPNMISKLILCSTVARCNVIKKPMYAKIMDKIPFYPGKRSNEKFEKLLVEAKDIDVNSLSKINVSTLVFNGGKKDIVSYSEAKYIADNIRNSSLVIIEKAGHCNYVINNKIFYVELFKFLSN